MATNAPVYMMELMGGPLEKAQGTVKSGAKKVNGSSGNYRTMLVLEVVIVRPLQAPARMVEFKVHINDKTLDAGRWRPAMVRTDRVLERSTTKYAIELELPRESARAAEVKVSGGKLMSESIQIVDQRQTLQTRNPHQNHPETLSNVTQNEASIQLEAHAWPSPA